MGLLITYTNDSSFEWGRNNWYVGAGESQTLNWADEITEQPKEKLLSHLDSTSAAAESAQFTSIVEDALWMNLGYGSGQGNIAVGLQQYFHAAGYGPQASWRYWDNGAWHEIKEATTYKWTFEKTWALATPTLSDTDASVTVVIHDIGTR
jgi:hypothetical protein